MTDESKEPPDGQALLEDLVASLTEIDSEVAQSLQHVMDEASRICMKSVATWLRQRCCHDDLHWGTYEDPAKCCYPLCQAATAIEKAIE